MLFRVDIEHGGSKREAIGTALNRFLCFLMLPHENYSLLGYRCVSRRMIFYLRPRKGTMFCVWSRVFSPTDYMFCWVLVIVERYDVSSVLSRSVYTYSDERRMVTDVIRSSLPLLSSMWSTFRFVALDLWQMLALDRWWLFLVDRSSRVYYRPFVLFPNFKFPYYTSRSFFFPFLSETCFRFGIEQ